MKKVLALIGLIIGSACSSSSFVHAQMYYNAQTDKYFTFPAGPEIDQEEYNKYAQEVLGNLQEISASDHPFSKRGADFIWGYTTASCAAEYDTDGGMIQDEDHARLDPDTADRFNEDIELIPSLYAFYALRGLR